MNNGFRYLCEFEFNTKIKIRGTKIALIFDVNPLKIPNEYDKITKLISSNTKTISVLLILLIFFNENITINIVIGY
jgi:hypothetical protein